MPESRPNTQQRRGSPHSASRGWLAQAIGIGPSMGTRRVTIIMLWTRTYPRYSASPMAPGTMPQVTAEEAAQLEVTRHLSRHGLGRCEPWLDGRGTPRLMFYASWRAFQRSGRPDPNARQESREAERVVRPPAPGGVKGAGRISPPPRSTRRSAPMPATAPAREGRTGNEMSGLWPPTLPPINFHRLYIRTLLSLS